jgi:hypothetical protein
MATDKENETKRSTFSIWKVLLPIAIGLAVVIWLFVNEASEENVAAVIRNIDVTPAMVLYLLLAWLFMVGREAGLSWRFRALTDRQLRWSQAIRVDMLCAFTSCITPSSVGGSSLGMIFLNREGIELGRATTLMITTLFLDELFFVVSCPIVVLLTPAHEIFESGSAAFSSGLRLSFWLIYIGITLWTILLFLGIIVKPNAIRYTLIKLFSLPILRRWKAAVTALGDNMVATSVTLKHKPLRFWLEAFAGTALSWTCRYLVVNALFAAFLPGESEQWLIFARQMVVWVILMVCPTPGGAGLSEWLFTEYYGDIIPTAGLALIIAVCWRIVSYYIYLLVGAIMIPSWLRGTYHSLRNRNKKHQ